MAVLAQFLYVAAQAGIFSFFINYMTSQVPPVPDSWTRRTLRPPDSSPAGSRRTERRARLQQQRRLPISPR